MKINQLSQYMLDQQLRNAIEYGDVTPSLKEALKYGANIHANDDFALRFAVVNGYFKLVKFLIKNEANINANNDEAIISASTENHLDIVKYLVENGANIHARNDLASKMALRFGHLEIVKYLISQMDPKYVLEKLPNFIKYIPNSVFNFSGKFIDHE